MKIRKLILIIAVLLSILCFSCSGYKMTVESLTNTLNQINDSIAGKRLRFYDLYDVIEQNKEYYNGLKTVDCVDHEGNPYTFYVTPKTSLTVRTKKGGKIKYFFDTLHFRSDSVIAGKIDRFDRIYIPVKIKDIDRLEIWSE